MNDEIVVFELPDGAVACGCFAVKGKRNGEVKAQWLNRVVAEALADRPGLAGAVRVNGAMMPNGEPFTPEAKKLYMGAWRHAGGGQIQINMDAARGIRMNEIREARVVKLEEADGPTAREVEQDGPNQAAWIAYKQALRDMPQTIDLATIATADELESFEPVWPTAPE